MYVSCSSNIWGNICRAPDNVDISVALSTGGGKKKRKKEDKSKESGEKEGGVKNCEDNRCL